MLGLLQSVVTIGIVACTMMFCLASRDFDLSVGSTVAFAGMIAVMASNATGSILLGLLAALVCGGFVGFVNGVVIAKFRINALITTLATMQIVRGLALIASDGRAVGINDPDFYQLALSKFLGIPTPIWVMADPVHHLRLRAEPHRLRQEHAGDRRQSGGFAAGRRQRRQDAHLDLRAAGPRLRHRRHPARLAHHLGPAECGDRARAFGHLGLRARRRLAGRRPGHDDAASSSAC